jgi:hypothetical protein
VVVGIEAASIPALLREAEFFMASVHPAIRWPDQPAPGQGGHLVLVHAASAAGVVFHNPSGHEDATRQDVTLPLPEFGRFFAGRGVAVYPESVGGGMAR